MRSDEALRGYREGQLAVASRTVATTQAVWLTAAAFSVAQALVLG